MLHITLFEARGLLSTDMFSSTANPYAFITLDRFLYFCGVGAVGAVLYNIFI